MRAVLDDVPNVDYHEAARVAVQKWAIDHLPPKLKAVYKEHSHWFKTDYLWQLPRPLSRVSVVSFDDEETIKHMKADSAFWESIEKMARDADAQIKARDALQSKIRAVIYSCNTVEQAHDRLPEFASYLKATTPAQDRSVPVVANLVSDLVAAGWPKGKKPATRKAAVQK
ncbi:Nmad5 family putative nucleotide modification protein [Caballeronia sp. LZ003]|uniref:Nmad5 family putative nucleotide modification protein n=1 Tax=unclassified Caballeronia TaxID=2646786 RepID=UPI0038575BD4